jgi:MoaA/NifB/PqqE/SkfB family radical SAM enzyme
MVRVDWILDILADWGKQINCWVFTSGFNLNLENARMMKDSGLKGVFISLDHHNKKLHNAFRGNDRSYDWVMQGIQNAKEADLLVCLSLCVTKEIVTPTDLANYMELGKNRNVDFVQFLEPKPVGHYTGKDVLLDQEQVGLLEQCYQKYNTSRAYKDFPVIMYHGYHQRRIGCFNAGQYGLYINTDGHINACPFCQSHNENSNTSILNQLESVSEKGCVEYGTVTM